MANAGIKMSAQDAQSGELIPSVLRAYQTKSAVKLARDPPSLSQLENMPSMLVRASFHPHCSYCSIKSMDMYYQVSKRVKKSKVPDG